MEQDYVVYDGRANYDPDQALVLSVADTLDEAYEDAKLSGTDWVIYRYTLVQRDGVVFYEGGVFIDSALAQAALDAAAGGE